MRHGEAMDWSVGRCGWYCFASLQGAQSEWAVEQARHAHACGTLNTLRTSCVACAHTQATSHAAVPTDRVRANLDDSCRLPRLEVIDVLHASNSGGRCRRGGQPTAARNAAKYTPGTCATLEIFTSAISRSCRRGLRQRAAGCARWRVYAEAVRRGCEHRAGASCLRVAGGLRRTRLASGCAVVLSR